MNPAPAPATSAPVENLAGLVERVTFHNEENGFCVLRLKARGQRDLVTVVGHAAMISAGEWVQAAGTWTDDRTHGLQFRANVLRATAPTTIDGTPSAGEPIFACPQGTLVHLGSVVGHVVGSPAVARLGPGSSAPKLDR